MTKLPVSAQLPGIHDIASRPNIRPRAVTIELPILPCVRAQVGEFGLSCISGRRQHLAANSRDSLWPFQWDLMLTAPQCLNQGEDVNKTSQEYLSILYTHVGMFLNNKKSERLYRQLTQPYNP